ncbi:MAG TPA: HD domain-containing phosphohydrolase [Dehalococcoidia bacterium]|nr:HD domain-containing phosphohydrolase [Dehalococcoidia bacterium]
MAALLGPGAQWSDERWVVAALAPLGIALERALSARGSRAGPSAALGASMAAGALGGAHGAAVVAPFVALSAVDPVAPRRRPGEALPHAVAALTFGAVFSAARAVPGAGDWPWTLLTAVAGAAVAAACFEAAGSALAGSGDDGKPASPEARALALCSWALLGVMAAGVAAVNEALGPIGLALFAAPAAWAQARLLQATKESRRTERALRAMRRQIERAEARAAQDLRALERLAAAIDERCYGDPDRSRRVAELAVALLRELPLDEHVLSEDELYRAALLRDVGLLRVPEDVLRSPGTLAHDERRAIMAHPEDGFWFLAGHGLSDRVLHIVQAHHERYDGGGYPRRLRSLSIPTGARILAVADALVAMLSARAYRDALPLEMALQELRVGRGTQFDPDVVDVCLALVERGGVAWLRGPVSEDASRVA